MTRDKSHAEGDAPCTQPGRPSTRWLAREKERRHARHLPPAEDGGREPGRGPLSPGGVARGEWKHAWSEHLGRRDLTINVAVVVRHSCDASASNNCRSVCKVHRTPMPRRRGSRAAAALSLSRLPAVHLSLIQVSRAIHSAVSASSPGVQPINAAESDAQQATAPSGEHGLHPR
ncbi:hypothetical protein P154DRAFT_569101 [Amniculicola lignicola CBS 123094]|uniref:Uncharacterized protein n=1 Tax=Amniculicola lignicola CBS 123094 TaxID=1392246 RepID=A0A6A5X167_9PLEO|nr:hypothetical protein P154DRAFT_569101 [Amniculicola lignicola CBS 123094]